MFTGVGGRRNRLLGAAIIVAASLVTVATTQAGPTPDPYGLNLIEPDLGDGSLLDLRDVNSDGSRILLGGEDGAALAQTWLVDVDDDATTPMPGDTMSVPPTEPPPFEFTKVGPKSFERRDTSTDEILAFDVELGVADTMDLSTPLSDDSGTILAFNVSVQGGPGSDVFVYDLASTDVLTPAPDGISTTAELHVVATNVASDGTTVDYVEYDGVGSQFSRYVRWHRATNDRTTIEMPAAHDPLRRWFVTPDFTRVVFFEAGTLTVRVVATGDEYFLPFPGPENYGYQLATDIRVVYQADTGGGIQSQLFVWDGITGETVELTPGIGGAAQTGPVETFFVSDDGGTVTFTSFADNLVDGTVGFARRPFQIRLPTDAPPTTSTTTTTVLSIPPPPPPDAAAQRIMNTRPGTELGGPTLVPGEQRCVAVVDAQPGDHVVVNVTPLRATGGGFGTVHSSDDPAGTTSSVNYRVGSTDPNIAITRVGADGEICFTNSNTAAHVDVLIDQLLTAPAGVFTTPTADGATRIMNTRSGVGGATLQPAETRCVRTVAADPGDLVVLNVTPVRASARGFGTLHSSDDPAGPTSNVNYDVGTIDPNIAITPVGKAEEVCFTNGDTAADVEVLIDELLVAPDDSFDTPAADGAVRLMNTRAELGGTRLEAGLRMCVPTNASIGSFAVVNITPVRANGRGFATMHPAGEPAGATSNVNFDVGTTDPNVAIVEVGTSQEICISNPSGAGTDVIIDHLLTAPSTVFSPPKLPT